MQASLQNAGNPRLIDIPTEPVYSPAAEEYFIKRRGFWLGCRDQGESAGKLRLGIHVSDEATPRRTAWDESPHVLEAVYAGNQLWSLYHDGVPVGGGRFHGDNTFIGFDGGTRLPISQYKSRGVGNGRDHNRNAFSLLLAGGGFKGGHVHGATDELGYRSVEDIVNVPDLHATILHQLDLDHTRLSYRLHGSDETHH